MLTDGQTDGQIDVMKLFVAFRSITKAPKNVAEMWSGIGKPQGCLLAIVLSLHSSRNRNKFE